MSHQSAQARDTVATHFLSKHPSATDHTAAVRAERHRNVPNVILRRS